MLVPASALVALVSLHLATPPAEGGSEHVLPPEAEGAVRALLGLDAGALDGTRLRVRIAGSRISISGADSEGRETLGVTLVHPSEAPPGAAIEGGVVLLEEPGPAPAALVAALRARMRSAAAGGVSLPWTSAVRRPSTAAEAPIADDPNHRALADAVHRALAVSRWRHAAGDPEGARRALEELPGPHQGGLALEVAIAWWRLGDAARASRILDGAGPFGPADALVAKAIRGEAVDVERVLSGLDAGAACGHAHVPGLLALLGRGADALRLASGLRERAPACPAAWESEVHRLLETGRVPDAVPRVREARKLFPDDRGLASLAGSVLMAAGHHREATAILIDLARSDLSDEGNVRVLLSAILRDPAHREEVRARLEAEVSKGGGDVLDRFLLGVIHHYGNDFERSNALLAPLEESFGHQQRLQIYRAMNDFNLGRVDLALERLDRAALRDLPDPDVFYCRAEILRDRDREKALADLERYRADVGGAKVANPEKEARVEGLVRSLRACLADGRPRCDGEWEHPRLRDHEPPRPPEPAGSRDAWPRAPWILGALAAVALAAFALATARRRRTS